ncbi:dialkylresorcinol condensing enzyme [Eikenella sp. S3360]|uniref:Dialkylresorcinol condensing enzyme n=1 Tax=Eikenella glucosivorans TaxID=2766967 RepID=A0ABS0NDA9_9NEIS|nr:dialkylrecorsinol condensing enzyme [Eikenella glucosivorans]MBH5330321.1 dialkylresorcinol condensing enzyme [Eikenella glucosivorans]
MVKRVLVVSYSQSGQLARLKESFLRDWRGEAAIEVDDVVLRPQRPFAFPWRFLPFFDAFPETVHLQPVPIEPPELAHERYDLVVIAYSVWFLSPAQPVTAFLQSETGRRALRDTPVITLIGCRNMWLMAQEKMKRLLADAGARLVGNVVKIDQCGSAASFITTPLWMFTGKRQAVPWLPEAGISEAEIADMVRFGRRTAEALRRGETLDETLLQRMGAVKINEKLMASERVGNRSFLLWGRLLMAAGRVSPRLRRLVLCVYIVFLLGLILTVVPLGALLKMLLSPLRREQMRRERAYYAAPSGE